VQEKDALSKIQTALGRAEKALEAENGGDVKNAYYWWNLAFGGYFSAY